MNPIPIPIDVIRQTDIPQLVASYRIASHPVVVRTERSILGGGFGDQERNPFTWTVHFLVDGQWMALVSARDLRREWSSLDRLEGWLREQGFNFFWVRNDLEGPAPAPL